MLGNGPSGAGPRSAAGSTSVSVAGQSISSGRVLLGNWRWEEGVPHAPLPAHLPVAVAVCRGVVTPWMTDAPEIYESIGGHMGRSPTGPPSHHY